MNQSLASFNVFSNAIYESRIQASTSLPKIPSNYFKERKQLQLKSMKLECDFASNGLVFSFLYFRLLIDVTISKVNKRWRCQRQI